MPAAEAIPDGRLRRAIGGWANGWKKKPSRKYGNKHGASFSITKLKKTIDKIGICASAAQRRRKNFKPCG